MPPTEAAPPHTTHPGVAAVFAIALLAFLGIFAIIAVIAMAPALVALVPLAIAFIPAMWLVWRSRSRRLALQRRNMDEVDSDDLRAADWYEAELSRRGEIVDGRVEHLLAKRG